MALARLSAGVHIQFLAQSQPPGLGNPHLTIGLLIAESAEARL
jgi:hypothetical protein